MIDKISYAITENTEPYENLALEELLLHAVEPGECILFLWQNRQTVVIGRNQNCHSECRTAELERDGGYLARRLSGGGAVFHDLGNLNFTFLVNSEDYDLDRQLEVILRAVLSLGINAEKSGRNDLTVDGKKFSGNAFYTSGNQRYHHGTIMVNSDKDRLSRYLNVSPDKLAAKGVKSVHSRVVNLCELSPAITIETLKFAVVTAFSELYGLTPVPIEGDRISVDELASHSVRFASHEWRMGKVSDYTAAVSGRFGWGGVELRLLVSGGSVTNVTVYTDAMDADLAPTLADMLTGAQLSQEGIKKALSPWAGQSDELIVILADIAKLMEDWQNG